MTRRIVWAFGVGLLVLAALVRIRGWQKRPSAPPAPNPVKQEGAKKPPASLRSSRVAFAYAIPCSSPEGISTEEFERVLRSVTSLPRTTIVQPGIPLPAVRFHVEPLQFAERRLRKTIRADFASDGKPVGSPPEDPPCEIILEFYGDGDSAASLLRDSVVLAAKLAQGAQGWIHDDSTGETWHVDRWIRERVDTWTDDVPCVAFHIAVKVVHARAWTTGGMQKLGLPDLTTAGFQESREADFVLLMELVAQHLHEDPRVGKGDPSPEVYAWRDDRDMFIPLRVDKIRNDVLRKRMESRMLPGAQGQVLLQTTVRGDVDERYISFLFPSGAWHVIEALFGR